MRVKLTPAQVEQIHRYADRDERVEFDAGVTWVEASREAFKLISFELEFALTDDHEAEIEGGSMLDLTEAQVAFGVRQRKRSILGAITKIDAALK